MLYNYYIIIIKKERKRKKIFNQTDNKSINKYGKDKRNSITLRKEKK